MIPISFVTTALAAGAALAAIPLIIHLVMRQTPKRVIFPALRLIRQRHKRSTKRLRIKNWLLLAARMLLLALMAFALARPRLYSQTALGDGEVPTALGLVFDTSLSMEYTERGEDRLVEAKRYANEILKKTPESSQVFVIDSADAALQPALSPSGARKRIESLALHPVTLPLNASLDQAYKAVAGSDRPRREVYVLTDLARSAWDLGRTIEGLKKAREVDPPASTYILRLTPKEVRDVAVVEADIRSSAGIATKGAPVEVVGKIRSVGPATHRVVQFVLDGQPRGKVPIDVPANGEVPVRFKTPKLEVGLHRATLSLDAGLDPLAFDDVRYLTFRVQNALRVLLIADSASEANFVANALDPSALPPDEPRPYRVDRLLSTQFPGGLKAPLNDYAGVFLLNVRRLEGSQWSRLDGYVRQGGGLVVAPGHRALAENYKGEANLLPALLDKAEKPPGGTSFGKPDFAHPLFARTSRALEADLSTVPVMKHFSVTPAPGAGAKTLLAYQDAAPALIERVFPGVKTGRVLLWTTPLFRHPEPGNPAAWNEFPVGQFWSFIEVMDQTIPYLAGIAGERLNFESGQSVSLPIDPSRRYGNYEVKGPGAAARLSPTATSASLEIEAPQALGQWTVTASGPEGQSTTMGFSVNPQAAESQIIPLERAELDALLGGKDRYQLADDNESLKRAIINTRVGHEIYPWIMLLILILITAENFLANRFHRENSSAAVPATPAAAR